MSAAPPPETAVAPGEADRREPAAGVSWWRSPWWVVAAVVLPELLAGSVIALLLSVLALPAALLPLAVACWSTARRRVPAARWHVASAAWILLVHATLGRAIGTGSDVAGLLSTSGAGVVVALLLAVDAVRSPTVTPSPAARAAAGPAARRDLPMAGALASGLLAGAASVALQVEAFLDLQYPPRTDTSLYGVYVILVLGVAMVGLVPLLVVTGLAVLVPVGRVLSIATPVWAAVCVGGTALFSYVQGDPLALPASEASYRTALLVAAVLSLAPVAVVLVVLSRSRRRSRRA